MYYDNKHGELIAVHLGRKPHLVRTCLNYIGGFLFSPVATSLSDNRYKCLSGWMNVAHGMFLPHRQSLQRKFIAIV